MSDLERFYGTGEKNRAGQSLEEFLAGYNPRKYDCPSSTTDIIVVRCREKLERWGQPMQVLMVKRGNHPSIGFWATPGGFVEMRENLEDAAARELEEETGVKGLPLEQLMTWGNYDRDPRWRVITTSFLALVEGDIPVKAGDDAADALWMDVELTREGASMGSVGEKDKADPREEIWNLQLGNGKHGIRIGARVRLSRSGHPLLDGEKYEIVESDGIAVDHGCLIVQALLHLKARLERHQEMEQESKRNKVVVVTGGAHGIGKAIAEAFLAEGAAVEVIDKAAGDHYVGDIGNRDVLEAFAGYVIGKHGRVDVLVNNALPLMKGIDRCTYEEFQYAMAVGVTAPFYLTKLLAPHFAAGASVVNISSSRDRMSQPQTESYTAAKGGIAALTHAMAMSLAGKARVNSISPGWIDTGYRVYDGPDAVQQPAGRVGNPDDIANMVLFLCSEKAGFITGENICIDGGMTRQMIYHGDWGWKLEP